MLTIPLAAVPAQNFAATLGGQAVQCSLYTLGTGLAAAMYMDLVSDGEPIYTARIVRAYSALPNNAPPFMTVGARYLGFEGDFLFIDTQATANSPAEDPQYYGLADRWQILYFSIEDLEGAGLIQVTVPEPSVLSIGITTLGGAPITTLGGSPLITIGSP